MAAWTDAAPLKMYNEWRAQSDCPGVYEIGFVRGRVFNPKYLGMSDVSVYSRLAKHYAGRGNQHIMEYYYEVKRVWMYWRRERDNLYFHFQRLQSGAAALREFNLLIRHGIGPGGYYEWNRKQEPEPED